MPKGRIYGKYEIDRDFYSGENADWQHQIYSFDITNNDEFIFSEKLSDGRKRKVFGKIEWYRNSAPYLFRIKVANSSLIDEYPGHYRGNCKFYLYSRQNTEICFTVK